MTLTRENHVQGLILLSSALFQRRFQSCWYVLNIQLIPQPKTCRKFSERLSHSCRRFLLLSEVKFLHVSFETLRLAACDFVSKLLMKQFFEAKVFLSIRQKGESRRLSHRDRRVTSNQSQLWGFRVVIVQEIKRNFHSIFCLLPAVFVELWTSNKLDL